ncbi:MAG: nicotinate (nicotinamide) nucleotide adenylyltransferase [Candidatus Kapaibacteriota bacterium]|jgi:nicotinate-nucleotide adenylyltransferase
MDIGIFGGSFNPVHIGHLIIANFFVNEFTLDKCFFVPNHISPFKLNDPEQLDDYHRLKMLELAIKGNPKFAIDTYEIDKKAISYSFETILYFKSKFQTANLFFLIGTDQLEKFTQWKSWNIILENANLVVARRNFVETKKDFLPIEYHNKIFFLNNPIIEICSTLIRDLIKANKSIDYLVPEKVKTYIQKNNLYSTLI